MTKYAKEYVNIVEKNLEYYSKIKQLSVIQKYKGTYYSIMNDYLIKKQIYMDDVPYIPDIIQNILDLFKIIHKAPVLEKSLEVYRGTRNAVSSKIINGKEIIYSDGFSSTSILKQVSQRFTNEDCCLYKIHLPKGTHILPIFSFYTKKEKMKRKFFEDLQIDYETELLLPPLCDFEVISKKLIYVDQVDYQSTKNKDLRKKTEEELEKILKIEVTQEKKKYRKKKILMYELKLVKQGTLKDMKKYLSYIENIIDCIAPLNTVQQIRSPIKIQRELPIKRNIRSPVKIQRELLK
jgi:hypothetical protein